MKGNYIYIGLGFVLACMSACTEDVPNIQMEDEASRIYLSAGVGREVSSRVPYYPTDGNSNALLTPTMEHPLDVSVWASTTSGNFQDLRKNGSDGTVAIYTEAHFQSGNPQLLGEAIYPKADENAEAKTVYFVGLHPQSKGESNWTPSNNHTQAYFTFTGKEDVMFAPQISGTYGTAYESSPSFHFYHLLTWLRIEMVADKDEEDVLKREDVSAAWGKIQSLTIKSKNEVMMDLTQDASAITVNNFGGEPTEMNLFTSSDQVFPVAGNDGIPTSVTEVAYVMCAPVVGIYKDTFDKLVPEYTLHIKTEKRELDIPIDLKVNGEDLESSYFAESTMGKQFTILLNFKMGDVISVATEISVGGDADWFTHGTGSGGIEEDDLN